MNWTLADGFGTRLSGYRRRGLLVHRHGVAHGDGVRLRQLDSVRGIAALIVVLNHYLLSVPEQTRSLADYAGGLLNPYAWATPWPWIRATPLRLLVDGQAAVDVFFVMSGFVLALTLTPGSQPRTWPFLVRRVCRVYVPFAVCILLAAVGYAVVPMRPSADTSAWINGFISSMSEYSLAGHLLMTGREQDMILNHNMWTLVHEMRVSLIMPLLFLALRRLGTLTTVLGCVLISMIASWGLPDSISGSWQATAHFLWMFAAGAGLSLHRGAVTTLLAGLRGQSMAALWVCAVVLLILPFDHVWTDFAIGSGALLVLALCLPEGSVARGLNAVVPLWLGRVSYSLYLIHLPVLIVTVGGGLMSPLVSFPLTLVLAELTYRGVEAPARWLGKRLIAKRPEIGRLL